MERPVSVRTIGRTAVLGAYLLAVAIAGRPVWLALLLAIGLALVWAAPLVLAPPRHRSPAASALLVAEPKDARPG
jgi:hypothetical protein